MQIFPVGSKLGGRRPIALGGPTHSNEHSLVVRPCVLLLADSEQRAQRSVSFQDQDTKNEQRCILCALERGSAGDR
eukprot:3227840-Rhodomonas_salina.1